MTPHEEAKAQMSEDLRRCHARVDKDVEKLKNRPEYQMLPTMVKCYVDVVILDIDLLKSRERAAHQHIDHLDEVIDTFQSTLQ